MTLFIKKTKNKDGIKETIWVNFIHNGKRYRKSLKLDYNPANFKLAKTKYLPELQYKLNHGEFVDVQKRIIPCVDEYIEKSFELRKGSRSSSTIYGHKLNYDKHIKPIFGNKLLNNITGNDITRWQNNLQEKECLAKSTILYIRSTLNSMFEDAIEDGIIDKNPVLKAKKLNETENPKVKRITLTPFKPEEINSILTTAEGQNRNMLATFFFTGLRASELIGLEWDAIDFNNKTITVKKQIVKGNHKTTLKTSKSRRIIPIVKTLEPFLMNQFNITGKFNSSVFLTERSKKHFHSAGKIREQIWIPTLEKAKVKFRNLHQTRGTFISTLISKGEDITYVSKIAGHENVKITLEKYSQYIPVKNENFGECFENMVVNL